MDVLWQLLLLVFHTSENLTVFHRLELPIAFRCVQDLLVELITPGMNIPGTIREWAFAGTLLGLRGWGHGLCYIARGVTLGSWIAGFTPTYKTGRRGTQKS